MSGARGRQAVILCEGYDDRSFWSGWLRHLGWWSPRERGDDPVDAWGEPVTGGGLFLFDSPAGDKIVVQPCHGRSKVAGAFEDYFNEPQRPDRLIVNVDCDAEAGGHPGRDLFHGILRDYGIAKPKGNGPFDLDGTRIGAVFWECEAGSVGIPPKQTLERLVSAAILAAHPDRGPAVDRWLADEPKGETVAKSFSFSYLAKWYADQGSDDFFRALWREKEVAAELEKLLRACGAWVLVEQMLRPT